MHIQPIPNAHAPAWIMNVAKAQKEVSDWLDLSPSRRADLLSHLSTAARMAGQPPETCFLTADSLRQYVFDRSATSYGIKRSSMRTLRSGLRYVARRKGLLDDAKAPLLPSWRAQLDLLAPRVRAPLVPFGRLCSALGIGPGDVTLETLGAYQAYRAKHTLTARPAKTAGQVRTTWNRACKNVPGWTGEHLGKRPHAGDDILPLTAFSVSFQQDLGHLGDPLFATPLDAPYEESNNRPLIRRAKRRASTVALRQSHARWAASAAVAGGVPITEIISLASLVAPLQNAFEALRYLWLRAGRQPSARGMHVAEVLSIIAEHHVGLPQEDVRQIKEWGKPHSLKYKGMTEHNQRTVREATQPANLERLLELPAALMAAARELHPAAPDQARSLAMRGVAIGILLQLPIRLANLVGLRPDRHFHRPDPRKSRITHLMIPSEETKTSEPISLPISPRTAGLIHEWITLHRSTFGGESPYLFPGQGAHGKPIGHQGMRDAIKGATFTYAGTAMSPHQFRHFAARLFLQEFPGHYEELRQFLGHKTIDTLTRHYSGIEGEQSAQRYDDRVLNRRQGPAAGRKMSPKPPRGSRPKGGR